MIDAAYVVLTIVFFAVTLLYLRGCERMVGPGEDASARAGGGPR